MKSQIISLCLALVFIATGAKASLVVTDPVLTAAIKLHEVNMQKILERQQKSQEQVAVAQTGVWVQMQNLHKIQDKALDYLQNANGALNNVFQIKHCAELIVDIGDECVNVLKAIKERPLGAVYTAFASKRAQNAVAETVSAAEIIKNLVTSGKKNANDSVKISLLNAAERYQVLTDIEGKLQSAKWDLKILAMQVQLSDVTDLWRGLDIESFYKYNYGKSIADRIIKSFG